LQEDAADFAPDPVQLRLYIGRENAKWIRVVKLSGWLTDEGLSAVVSVLSVSALAFLVAVIFLAAVVPVLVVVFAVLLGEPGG
jgi:hypothetical protein